MSAWKWIGEIFGAIAIFENIFVFLAEKRENILKLRCLSDLLWITSFLCLGGYTAAVLNAIDAIATVVFCYREKCKRLDHPLIPCLSVLFGLISPVAEWITGGFSFRPLLCAAGSTLMLIALWQKKPSLTRFIAIFSDALWLWYSLLVPSISGVVCNAILILSTLYAMLRPILSGKSKGQSQEKPSVEDESSPSDTDHASPRAGDEP